ncbi:MAG: cytochrome c oxidase subunit 3, partial [Candidatus Omnitrophica bacterium]|nr:cytochrome c oxidase subunit 3 [Candidatus Omnitrophota bacterium]
TSTGIPSGKLGLWVFLASEVMFFTGLIGAYVVLRMGHPAWPGSEGHLNVGVGTVNTLLLICSSTTIVLALAASGRGALGVTRGWLLATVGLGSSFLVIKAFEYAEKFSHHIFPGTNVFWSCYFVLTGFHALHVLGGIVFNLWVLAYARSRVAWAARGHRLEYAGLYWHFVDIVWIFLFPMLYLF